MAAIGAFPLLGDSTDALSDPATLPHPTGMPDYYEKLGVKKIINAYDTITELTGSVMPLEVQQAVAQAAKTHVYLRELQGATGEYIAKGCAAREPSSIAARRRRSRSRPQPVFRQQIIATRPTFRRRSAAAGFRRTNTGG